MSFDKIKNYLVKVLSCPDYDFPFEVHYDAGGYGVDS